MPINAPSCSANSLTERISGPVRLSTFAGVSQSGKDRANHVIASPCQI